MNNTKNILVTGSAGFIGFHLVCQLLKEGHKVTGLDNINDYYSVDLKYDRLAITGIERETIEYGKAVKSKVYENYTFYKMGLEDRDAINSLFEQEKFEIVINLAAQAGVRYSITNPQGYIVSNITGFFNILEACRAYPVEHLVYASSSSVYGINDKMPLSLNDNTDNPVSLYAATKKSNELMAYTYSHLYGIPATGLRFFTVYGPYGRPDMAFFSFTNAILSGKTIDVYNNGSCIRDFTYVDDIVEGVKRVSFSAPKQRGSANGCYSVDNAPHKVYNIGNGNPVNLMDFIDVIERSLGVEANKRFLPPQPGDVVATNADMSDFIVDFDFKPKTTIEEGIGKFVKWYRGYYNV